MKRHIPNIFTSINLLCGAVAVIFAAHGELVVASYLVFTGIFFDFFDGLAARQLQVQSEVGVQLDSLADLVTSGLAPAVVMVQLLSLAVSGDHLALSEGFFGGGWNSAGANYTPFLGLLVVVGSAYRLAKFNVDDRQRDGFIGLPTPANAILLLSLPLILEFQPLDWATDLIANQWFLLGLILLSCVLMNAEIRLFALKFKEWGWKSNALRYVFLLLVLALVIWLRILAFPVIILLYILLSLMAGNRT